MSPLSTSNSNWPALRAFCKRAGGFFVPLLGLLALFEFALWRTGESWPLSHVVHVQTTLGATPSLYGRQLFSQQFNLYKYAMLKAKHPKIVIHGTSRVMQVRDFMFHPLESWVYNAGGMIQGPNDVATYAQLVHTGDVPKPAVIIMGVDPWWVKQGDPHTGWLDKMALRDDVRLFPAHIEAFRLLLQQRTFPWQAVLTGAPSPSPYYRYQAIGAKPLLDGSGFRADGSLQIPPEFVRDSLHDPRHEDRLEPSIVTRVTRHLDPFTLPAMLDASRVTVLLAALSRLQHMGVEVYVFLPPFTGAVQAALDTSPRWATFWRAYHTDLPARLRAAGIFCLPLSVPTQDGFDDTYMYDGYHPSEIYMTAIVGQIVQHAPRHSLLRQIDLAYLKALLSRDHVTPLSFEKPPGQFG